MKKMNLKKLIKPALMLGVIGLGCTAEVALAGNADGLGGVAQTVTGNLSNVAKLITAGSYVAGLGFAISAILKFKAHKDNPTQIPVGTPIALVFIAAALLFLPSLMKSAGSTLFKSGGQVATSKGIDNFGQKYSGS